MLEREKACKQTHALWYACADFQERVPFQYLIASSHWRQHVLAVGPGVLIPRPETEIFAGMSLRAHANNIMWSSSSQEWRYRTIPYSPPLNIFFGPGR